MNTSRLTASSPASRRVLSVTAAALLALTLAACGRHDDERTAGQKLDGAIASAEHKTEVAKAEVKDAAAEARADMKDAGAEARAGANAAVADAKAAGREVVADAKAAGREAASSVDDAGITVAVNAALAGDPKLSALKIDVDTDKGHVALKGTAPDDSSRRRATDLARAVKGVVAVDNRLVVAKG
ncbi:MAG: BON domain-containing protein [Sphaerotilus natans]